MLLVAEEIALHRPFTNSSSLSIRWRDIQLTITNGHCCESDLMRVGIMQLPACFKIDTYISLAATEPKNYRENTLSKLTEKMKF